MFLKELRWLDCLVTITLSLFLVTYDFVTLQYTKIDASSNINLYGFPLPNKTGRYLDNILNYNIYLIPYAIDIFVYFIILTIIFWYVCRYMFDFRLKKKIFVPLIFGIIFIVLIPFILPNQDYGYWLNDIDLTKYTMKFNWYGR